MNKSQTIGMVLATILDAYGRRGCYISLLQDFQFNIIHRVSSRHLNVDAFNKNLENILEEDDDFGCDVMESYDKSLPMGDQSTNDTIINLFILQFMDQEIVEYEEHQIEVQTKEQNMDFMLEEETHQMTPRDHQRMVIKGQTMVDNAKDKQKNKYVGTIGLCEEEQLKQMDIWEDKVAMVLLINGHLEVDIHEVSSIKRAKKKVMKYHWAEDILFFENLMVLILEEIRTMIQKIHKEIGYFGELWTLVEVKKHFF